MNLHTPKWTPMLGVGVPKRLSNFQSAIVGGQNSSPRKVLYVIEKLLKRRCLKWARITHLDIWNTSYGQKKGWESKWQFDSWPLKVKNQHDFLACRWRARYRWKALDEGYNFGLDYIALGGLHRKLCTSKVTRVLAIGILGLPLGSARTKSHLDVTPVESCKG
jgi:hypothetical protein